MKFSTAAALALLSKPAAAQDTSPVNKVLQLLSDLQAKVVKEGEDAQRVYSEFSEWCEDRSRSLTHEIQTGKSEVSELQAAIQQGTASIGSLQAKVEQLASDLSVDEADLKAATEIRAKEGSSFETQQKELVEIIGTLQRAIGILEREMHKKGSAALVQLKSAGTIAQALSVLVDSSMLTTADASRLTALVQSSTDEDDGPGAPAAAAYEGHSGGIVQVLTDLLDKAEDQLQATRNKETQDLHAFEMLQQSLKDEIKFGNKEMAEAKQSSAAASEQKATAAGELDMTSKELTSDTKALDDMHHECMTKAEDFEAETKSRGEELNAIAAAKKVLQEGVGGASDLSYGLNQVSFIQSFSAIHSSVGLAQFEAMRLIRDLARKEHSPELAQLAARMSSAIRTSSEAGQEPFAKVKQLIQDLVERLEKEAGADATQKAFCDKELAESNEKKSDKTTDLEKLSTHIDSMSAKSAQLKEEVAMLQNGLSELSKSQAEMDKLRSLEKEAFAKNKADMDQGLEAVKMALKILSEYYAKDSAADGAGAGIIGLLEVVESDFTKGLAEMSATEENAQDRYDAQSKENAIDRATKEQDVQYKTRESTSLDQATSEATSDRAGVQAELDAVLEYLRKIEEQCIVKAESYEERKARFDAELAGLREALRVLEDETTLLQKSSLRGVRRHHVA